MQDESESNEEKKPCWSDRPPYKDPLQDLKEKDRFKKKISKKEKLTKVAKSPPTSDDECDNLRIQPSMGARLVIHCPEQPPVVIGRGEVPTPMDNKLKFLHDEERKRKLKYVCKKPKIKLPLENEMKNYKIELAVPSAEIQEAKVKPKLTTPDASFLYPYEPEEDRLDLKKPKSGIFINETDSRRGDPDLGDYDSFDLVYKKQPRPKKPDHRRRSHSKNVKRTIKRKFVSKQEGEGKRRRKKRSKKKKAAVPSLATIEEGDEEDHDQKDSYLTKQFRKKVAQISISTSYQSRDIKSSSSSEVEIDDLLNKYQQKFQRESDLKRYEPQRRKIKRGTLESHSFTNVKYQVTLKDFYFGSKTGTMNQGDENFSEEKDKQGICIPIAAYCYAVMTHPSKWICDSIDEILRVGTSLYKDCIATFRQVKDDPSGVQPKHLSRFLCIGEKKIYFKIDDPEVTGYIRSVDKRIYNLTKGLRIFFARKSAGLFQTCDHNLMIWKDKHFYLFDGNGRTEDLFVCKEGTAVLAHFYDIESIVTVILNRSNYGNGPFVIYPLVVTHIVKKSEFIKFECGLGCTCNYRVINDFRAVVHGTLDLGNKNFEFTRNKQALAMSAVCLVYTRITPSSAWQKQTIDKILIIGNQLYTECAKNCLREELEVANLPAIFTIGPYIVEIYIYANRFVDVMYKKCCCEFRSSLTKCFETNNNLLVQIGPFSIAVWKQRNMYFYFDPYSRDCEGLSARNGTACVSMHTDIDSLVDLIIENFDSKDYIFNIHTLKVCRIHRDPVQSKLFPRHIRLNDFPDECIKDFRMKKSKKVATAKPITVECSVLAIKQLLNDEEMEPSLMEVGSTVSSLMNHQVTVHERKYPTFEGSAECQDDEVLTQFHELVADLDSPSLSDTQIKPQQITDTGEEEIELMDLDAFALTQDELELQDMAEEEGEGKDDVAKTQGGAGDYEIEFGEGEQEGEEEIDWFEIENAYAQVGGSLMENIQQSRMSKEINTEITSFFPIKKQILYPTFIRDKQKMRKRTRPRKTDDGWEDFIAEEPTVSKSEELRRETNFTELPDGSQIVRGSQNLINLGEDIEFIAPFVCVMACVVSKKFDIFSWSSDLVDYVLRGGAELYKTSKVRYDQVIKLEIPRVSLGRTNYKVLVQYVFDTYCKLNIIELAIEKILFVRSNMGVLVTPTYACALIFKNHLYYMFDGFGNNEVGLSEGPTNTGTACLARFKDVHSLALRIMHNKRKREFDTGVVYSRFVISSVRAKQILPDFYDSKRKLKKIEKEMEEQEGETDYPKESAEQEGEAEEEAEKEKKATLKPGYQLKDGLYVIEGSTALVGRETQSKNLKEDHFVAICADLLLLILPIRKWNSKKVDESISNGKHVFSHASDLERSAQRSIKNVLIDKYYFNLTIKEIKIEQKRYNTNLSKGIDTLLKKKQFHFLLQCPSACYAVYINAKGVYHLFDPYGIKKGDQQFNAGWIRFKDMSQFQRFLLNLIKQSGGSYQFYNFEINSFEKAPKKLLLKNRLEEFEEEKPKRKPELGEPLFEDMKWMDSDTIPWSLRSNVTASGEARGDASSKWRNWDIEYANDLFSLMGNVSQLAETFSTKSRGKQTLCNLITAIGMTKIYDLSEWNAAVIDSVIVNGDNYFMECTKEIEDENYELSVDDLRDSCSVFPFEFKIALSAVVDGIMFLARGNQYNLYKALRYFFTRSTPRYGIITATRNGRKKHLAFGRIQDNEFFMFDADSFGAPLFNEREGFPYMLKMNRLNRLLHVLTMTLRGGEFYIFDVQVSGPQAMQ